MGNIREQDYKRQRIPTETFKEDIDGGSLPISRSSRGHLMMLDGSYGDDQLEKNLGNKRLNDFTFASLSQNNRDMIRDHITESDTTNNMVKDETITKDMIEEEAKAYMNKEIKFDPQSRNP